MIHFENIYLEAAGREQQSEGKKSTGVKSRGAESGGRRERGIASMGGNQGSEITKNPSTQQLAPVVLGSLWFFAEQSSAAMVQPLVGA